MDLAHRGDQGFVVVHQFPQHVEGRNEIFVVVLDRLQPRDMAE
jgi:hypothetical protein